MTEASEKALVEALNLICTRLEQIETSVSAVNAILNAALAATCSEQRRNLLAAARIVLEERQDERFRQI